MTLPRYTRAQALPAILEQRIAILNRQVVQPEPGQILTQHTGLPPRAGIQGKAPGKKRNMGR